MSELIIDKTDVRRFLDGLLETRQVFAPIEREGILGMELLTKNDEVQLDYSNTQQAPKQLFFPRSEVLFTYELGKVIPASLSEEPRVVFGIRPCDARSSALLDMVFDTEEEQDPYYVNRRQRTVLIGLGCNEPQSTCFCTSVSGGPFSVEGLDMLWTDLGDRYLVETITERGEALVVDNPLFRQATAEDTDRKTDLAARAEQMISGPSVEGIKETLDGMFDDPFWDEVHLKCLGCGVCTFLCPTCHCFDIVDEGNSSRGQRVRNWDTCQFALFTHHTSGHNPRPSGKQRMRQRVMHKFNYFVENQGAIACVGCGRCVRQCPVNLDIRAVLGAIGQMAERVGAGEGS
jgi:sulfhydrogenase subunit beta (sulfur reductase)